MLKLRNYCIYKSKKIQNVTLYNVQFLSPNYVKVIHLLLFIGALSLVRSGEPEIPMLTEF